MFSNKNTKYVLLRKNSISRDEEFVYDTREKAENAYQATINMVKSLGLMMPITYILYEDVDGRRREIKKWERKVL